MMLKWFNAREAADLGGALADQFVAAAPRSPPGRGSEGKRKERATALRRVARARRSRGAPLQLNFYQKARFANSFKWRLIENGVESGVADAVTQSLLVQAFSGTYGGSNGPPRLDDRDGHCAQRLGQDRRTRCTSREAFAEGDYARAAGPFRGICVAGPGSSGRSQYPRSRTLESGPLSRGGTALPEAIDVNPEYANALINLAALLQAKPRSGRTLAATGPEDKPEVSACARRCSALCSYPRVRIVRPRLLFRKALKVSPKDPVALLGSAQIARMEGRFDEAQSLLKRTLEISPKMPTAWAALNGTRKMTAADSDWFATAEEIADSGIPLWDETPAAFCNGQVLRRYQGL